MPNAPLINGDEVEERVRIPNSWSLCCKEVSAIPLLTRDDELELAERSQSGETVAKHKLIRHNLRFVFTRVKEFRGYLRRDRSLEYQDLFQWGSLGLTKAAENYRPNMGTKFISYAVWHIDGKILNSLVQNRLIRVKSDGLKLVKLYVEAETKILQADQKGYAPIDEVAIEMGVREKMATEVNLWREMLRVERLDSFQSEEDGATEYPFPGEECLHPDLITEMALLPEVVELRLWKRLKKQPRHLEIIQRGFGLNGQEKESKETMADRFDLTPERIRQIRVKTLRTLQRDPGLIDLWLDDPYLKISSLKQLQEHLRNWR